MKETIEFMTGCVLALLIVGLCIACIAFCKDSPRIKNNDTGNPSMPQPGDLTGRGIFP